MYYCKHCGAQATNLSSLTASTCFRHPRGPNQGKHVLYEGSVKSRYECKYCGAHATSISSLTACTCFRHPLGNNKGKHEPAL